MLFLPLIYCKFIHGLKTKHRDASVSARSGKALSENEIVAALPADAEEKNGRLFDMALESASNFFGSHNLQVNLPAEATQSVARAIEEGSKYNLPVRRRSMRDDHMY